MAKTGLTQRQSDILLAAVISVRATSMLFSKIVLAGMDVFNLMALNPLVASVLGVVFLHEVLSAKAILGELLVLAGILLYSVKTKPAE